MAEREAAAGCESTLTEAEKRAAEKAVTMSCVKYADLSCNREKAYVFDFDRMLDPQGNTGCYLLYAFMRIRSIARTAGVDTKVIPSWGNLLSLKEKEERKLAKRILQWYDRIEIVEKEMYMHVICDWLYDVAKLFTEFYGKHFVVIKNKETKEVEKVHKDRLMLCELTAVAMKRAFDVLGFHTVEKM